MQRRKFLTASLAASALTLAKNVPAQTATAPTPSPSKPREYYLLRRYHLSSGPQGKLTENYFSGALIPALTRLGAGPVGAFRLDVGPETPTYYLLVPSTSLETLTTLDLQLADDAAFTTAAAPFWGAPAIAPAFQRVDGSLLSAFPGWPKLTPPDAKAKRIFQLRTYESPSNAAHVRKVEMFHSGEFDSFTKAGAHGVFYADTLVGDRTPSLTYMLSFPDMNALNTAWDLFRNDPAWKKISGSPRYNYEAIVGNVSNLMLSPLSCSQV